MDKDGILVDVIPLEGIKDLYDHGLIYPAYQQSLNIGWSRLLKAQILSLTMMCHMNLQILFSMILLDTDAVFFLQTEGELVEAVDRDLRKMLINPNAKDPLVLGVRVWPKAIPQFLVGHLDLLDTAKTALRDSGFHGLFLGGNYVSGVALGRCVEGAYEVAAEVKEFLSQYAYK